MNDTRAKFEEIWPVPDGVYWSPVFGAYVCAHGSPVKIECIELNLRLDTFTRCQETTSLYVSIIDELVTELECITATIYTPSSDEVIDRAKKIMEHKK